MLFRCPDPGRFVSLHISSFAAIESVQMSSLSYTALKKARTISGMQVVRITSHVQRYVVK